MYIMAVEIHSHRQLERLHPGRLAQVIGHVNELVAAVSAEVHRPERGVSLYAIPNSPIVDRAGVVGTLAEVARYLRSRSGELFGWSVLLDDVPDGDAAVEHGVPAALRRAPSDDQVWLTAGAQQQLGSRVTLDRVDTGGTELYRLVRAERVSGTVQDRTEDDDALDENVDRVLACFDIAAADQRGALILCAAAEEARRATGEALQRLYGTSGAGPVTMAPAHGSGANGPLLTSIGAHATAAVVDALETAERVCWDERLPVLAWAAGVDHRQMYPSAVERDIELALELFFIAYARRCGRTCALPVLVLEDVHLYRETEPARVANVVARVARAVPELRIMATSAEARLGPDLRSLLDARIRLRVPRRSGQIGILVRSGEEPALEMVLLVLNWATAVLGHELVVAFLKDTTVATVDPARAIEQLVADGEVRDQVTLTVTDPGLAEEISHRRPLETRRLREELAAFVVLAVEEGRVRTSEALLELLQRLGHVERLPVLYARHVADLLVRGCTEDAQRLLYAEVPSVGLKLVERRCMENVVQCGRIALALAGGDLREAARNETLLGNAGDVCEWLQGDAALVRARYLIRVGERGQGIELLKQALIRYSELGSQEGVARANIDFGVHLLAMQDMLGAREYFGLGAKDAVAVGSVVERARATLYETVMLFVTGNYSRVLENAVALEEQFRSAGLRQWQLFTSFLSARSEFDLGRYEEAAAQFLLSRNRARLYACAAADELLQRWYARSVAFDGRAHLAVRLLEGLPECRESLFFLGEARQLMGENLAALEVLSRALEAPQPADAPVAAISWQTGFTMLEDRVIHDFPVLEHQVMALRGYVLAQSGDTEGGVRELYRLTKEVQTSDLDPYNRYYYFLYGSILPENGPLALEDRTTILGRAVRFIQDRTSRIDRYADKADFMRRSLWNQRLLSRASQLNLV